MFIMVRRGGISKISCTKREGISKSSCRRDSRSCSGNEGPSSLPAPRAVSTGN